MVKTKAQYNRLCAAIATVALAMVTLFAMSACSQDTEPPSGLSPKLESGTTITDGTLTVGINGSDSPYGGTNASNETVGLDVDVAAALADELGMQLQIVDVNSNGRSALEDKQVDLVLDQTKTNANQPTSITYTSAYITDGTSLFCLSGNEPDSLSSLDLDGGKILAQKGTASAYAVQESLGSKSVQTTSSLQEAFEALESGEQKYLVTDAVVGDYFARNYSDVQRVGFISSSSTSEVCGTMLSENTELTTAVDEALDSIEQNGVLRVVAAKWLGSDAENLLPGNVDLSKLPQTAFGSN